MLIGSLWEGKMFACRDGDDCAYGGSLYLWGEVCNYKRDEDCAYGVRNFFTYKDVNDCGFGVGNFVFSKGVNDRAFGEGKFVLIREVEIFLMGR